MRVLELELKIKGRAKWARGGEQRQINGDAAYVMGSGYIAIKFLVYIMAAGAYWMC